MLPSEDVFKCKHTKNKQKQEITNNGTINKTFFKNHLTGKKNKQKNKQMKCASTYVQST